MWESWGWCGCSDRSQVKVMHLEKWLSHTQGEPKYQNTSYGLAVVLSHLKISNFIAPFYTELALRTRMGFTTDCQIEELTLVLNDANWVFVLPTLAPPCLSLLYEYIIGAYINAWLLINMLRMSTALSWWRRVQTEWRGPLKKLSGMLGNGYALGCPEKNFFLNFAYSS